MEEERIDPQDVRRLSQALTACNVALGGYLAISFFGFFRSMRELFEGMSLALPLATKLMLSPLAALVPVVLVMVVVAKEVVLNTGPSIVCAGTSTCSWPSASWPW
ncbi:MAG: hypothetical protein KC910_12530 [Candidatus Eremiobacteraeota bacterium]|nr:hypothetical protein [Candidatus Eremiobacteraeota bacterium]